MSPLYTLLSNPLSPLLVMLLIISIMVLLVQTTIDDARIILVVATGYLLSSLLTIPGTNGELLIVVLSTLAVLGLMAPVIYRNFRQARIWVPLLSIAVATASLTALYFI